MTRVTPARRLHTGGGFDGDDAHTAQEARGRAQAMAAQSAPGVPLDLVAPVTSLLAGDAPVPGTVVEHQAPAPGHAAVLRADCGVLLAGDMLSDVLIPLLDPRRPGQVAAYEAALDQLGEASRHVDVVVPGHGSVATGGEVAARLAADRANLDALRPGDEPAKARLAQEWLSGPTSRTSSRPDARPYEAPGVGRSARSLETCAVSLRRHTAWPGVMGHVWQDQVRARPDATRWSDGMSCASSGGRPSSILEMPHSPDINVGMEHTL